MMHAMIAATAGTSCAPLVRLPSIDQAEVKAALDAGAEGVVFPLVRTSADAARCVSYMRYPPDGVRGWGAFIAHSRHQTSLVDYAHVVGPQVVCGLLLETVEAVENIDEILRVPGIDFVVPAHFDLSTALGVHGQFDSPIFVDAITTLERAVQASGIPAGGAALTPEQTSSLLARHYRVLFQGFDVLMLEERMANFKTWN
jgi:4-hydroxy-2-oxoheptanedioate aldolase